MTMNEQQLADLYRFAVGDPPWGWTGPYMHTFPTGKDDLHAGCLELERRGLLKRHVDELQRIVWVRASPWPVSADVEYTVKAR